MNRTSTLLICVISLTTACSESGPPPLSWHSPKVLAVKTRFQALVDSFEPETKDNSEQHSRQIEDVFKVGFSQQDLRGLARTSGTVSIDSEWPFARCLLDFMIMSFAAAGDRESLVTLLSTQFPAFLYMHLDIEYLLAGMPQAKALENPILVLGEAYARSAVPEVRHRIAQVVRRGFRTMQIPELADDLDDAKYVQRAMHWYSTHKDELMPNLDYDNNAYTFHRVDAEGVAIYDEPLFKWKSAAADGK